MKIERIFSSIKEFLQKKIVVIGDSFLQTSYYGDYITKYQENQLPVLSTFRQEHHLGGASLLAWQLAQFRVSPQLVTVDGVDEHRKQFRSLLASQKVDTHLVETQKDWQTPVKHLIYAGGVAHFQFYTGLHRKLEESEQRKLQTVISKSIDKADLVVIHDDGTGMMSDEMRVFLFQQKRRYVSLTQKWVVEGRQWPWYSSFASDMVKMDLTQALNLSRLKENEFIDLIRTSDDLIKMLFDKTGSKRIFIGGRNENYYLSSEDLRVQIFPKGKYGSQAFFPLLLLYSLTFLPEEKSLQYAYEAAEIEFGRYEKNSVFVQLEKKLISKAKIIPDRRYLDQIVRLHRSEGERIVFTNGCFDILHSGHIDYLNQARQQGDLLIVAVNSDQSVRRLKGETRPVNQLEERMRVLAGLDSVSYVINFSENTPINLVKRVRPDVYVKGGDYTRETLPETPWVEKYGGKVFIVPYLDGKSTTKVINKISKLTKEKKKGRKLYGFPRTFTPTNS